MPATTGPETVMAKSTATIALNVLIPGRAVHLGQKGDRRWRQPCPTWRAIAAHRV